MSSRVRRPSIASSTCSAITGPTLPRSSRIASTLRTTRIRNSRSPSSSPTGTSPVGLLPLLVALADEVVDENSLGLLAVAVDTAVPLLHAVGVPRNLVVDQPGAVVLEVETFGGGIGGQQDAHGALVGSGLERRFDRFPLLRVHAAVHRHQPVAAREPFGRQDRLQPVLRGPVLGEDDDPLVRPLAAGADVVLEPVDQLARLCCRRGPWRVAAHSLICFSRAASSAGRFTEQPGGRIHGIVGGLFQCSSSAYSSSTRSICR